MPAANNKHFDTFETTFFAQGDASESVSTAAEQWGDLDDGHPRRFAPSRQLVVAVAIGTACLAAIGCVALWRSGGHAHRQPTVAVPEHPPAPAVAPAPAPAPVTAQSAQPSAEPAVPAAAPGTTAEPTTVPAPPAPAAVVPAPVAAAPVAAPPSAAAPTVGLVPAESAPTAAPANSPDEASSARETCVQAIRKKRGKDILSACAQAFEADPTSPSSAEPAVAVARVEFERGRAAQALAWGKKAIALDPDAADAYVFIGGAEQNAGHGKAAKEAYRRYLQLAPGGRYAADLRAIVGSL